MRIALVTHRIGLNDGQGRVNLEIAKAALNAGHELTVIADECSEEISTAPRARFVKIDSGRVPTQLLHDMRFAAQSERWLRTHRAEFDIVQANGFVTWEPVDVVAVHFVHSAWLKHRFYPFRWSLLHPYSCYQRLFTVLNAHWEKSAFRHATKLIAVSGFTAGEVAGLGIPKDRIAVVYNGVDTDEFCPGTAERLAFGLPGGVPMSLFVGDIRTKRKNLEAVLKSLQAIPELHLAVAGKVDGSPYPSVAVDFKVADRVHFIGKTSRIPALMRSVDFFVFPSRYEAHPLVLLEAMASGLPVLVSNNFDAADYVGEGGKVFGDADDIAGLTSAMRESISHPERTRAMGVAARERALTMQWSQTAAGYLKVYDELMELRKR